MYKHGQGVEQSNERAAEYYEQAAHLGHANGQKSLGVLYYNGNGVEQSNERAVAFFTLSAQQGDDTAMSNLGLLYYHGLGVDKDMAKAREYFAKAAAQGNAASINHLKQIDDMEGRTSATNTTKLSSNPDVIVCANCQASETETHKLIRCPCHSVRYCNKACQKSHRKKHKKDCRRLLVKKNTRDDD
jgi:TPR repeat protein